MASAAIPGFLQAGEWKEKIEFLKRESYGANDQIQIALIGAGGMGNADLSTALTVPGVKLVAACDLYDGRLAAINSKYGKDIFVTRDYKEVLSRKDIDAVIVATPITGTKTFPSPH
jgi:predicted homoserine dehydrogenase-like protein